MQRTDFCCLSRYHGAIHIPVPLSAGVHERDWCSQRRGLFLTGHDGANDMCVLACLLAFHQRQVGKEEGEEVAVHTWICRTIPRVGDGWMAEQGQGQQKVDIVQTRLYPSSWAISFPICQFKGESPRALPAFLPSTPRPRSLRFGPVSGGPNRSSTVLHRPTAIESHIRNATPKTYPLNPVLTCPASPPIPPSTLHNK